MHGVYIMNISLIRHRVCDSSLRLIILEIIRLPLLIRIIESI